MAAHMPRAARHCVVTAWMCEAMPEAGNRFDVLVVGAGPAGIAAACAAAESGARVGVVDDNPGPGGQIWRGLSEHAPTPQAAAWRARLQGAGVTLLSGATVISQPARGMVVAETWNRTLELEFDKLILATGARERFLPFPGWTLPGVLGAGGLQAMVKSGLPIAGKRVVIAGSGPLLLAVASSLHRAGAEIEAIVEQASRSRLARFGLSLAAQPGKLLEGARYRWQTRGVPYRTGSWVTRALGRDWIEAVVVTDGRTSREIACDYLACGFHLVPNLELAELLGCRIEGGHVQVNAVQETSVHNVFCVGEPTGIGGLDKAILEGRIAGLAAAGRLNEAARLLPQRERCMHYTRRLDAAFALRPELRSLANANTIVCRCEDVTHGELSEQPSGRAAKLHTRCGMGPCQARICGPATEFLFGWSAARVRPPLFPARIATLASHAAIGTPEPGA